MELIDYVRMVGRRWGWVLSFTLIGLALGGAWAFGAPKSYTATSELFVGSVVPASDTKSSVEAQAASRYALDRMPSYAALVKSPDIATTIIAQLQLGGTPGDVTRSLSATVPAKTVLVRITAQGEDPVTTAAVANAAASALGAKIERLEGASQAGGSPVSASVARPATVPVAPSSPDRKLSLALGLIGGLGLGLLAASLRDQAVRRPSRTADAQPAALGVQTDPVVPPLPGAEHDLSSR